MVVKRTNERIALQEFAAEVERREERQMEARFAGAAGNGAGPA